MKKYLVFLSLLLTACNNGDQETKIASASASEPAKVDLPYEIGYSSQFEIADAAKSKIILDIWKDFDQGTLEHCKNMFADSVTINLAGGQNSHASRDSIIAMVQNYRNTMAAVTSKVDAVLSTRSTDKNQNWVCVWGSELDTYKDGKMDSVGLMESWRFDKDGKVDRILQYNRKLSAPK
jgi:hypothetical protein